MTVVGTVMAVFTVGLSNVWKNRIHYT